MKRVHLVKVYSTVIPLGIGIAYPEHDLKKELWTIVSRNRGQNVKYVIDEMAAANGELDCLW
jgi:hypothetical protein